MYFVFIVLVAALCRLSGVCSVRNAGILLPVLTLLLLFPRNVCVLCVCARWYVVSLRKDANAPPDAGVEVLASVVRPRAVESKVCVLVFLFYLPPDNGQCVKRFNVDHSKNIPIKQKKNKGNPLNSKPMRELYFRLSRCPGIVIWPSYLSKMLLHGISRPIASISDIGYQA